MSDTDMLRTQSEDWSVPDGKALQPAAELAAGAGGLDPSLGLEA